MLVQIANALADINKYFLRCYAMSNRYIILCMNSFGNSALNHDDEKKTHEEVK